MKILRESIHDKYLFKCIFLAGGPGSGKSFLTSLLADMYSPKDIMFSHDWSSRPENPLEAEDKRKSKTKWGLPTYRISNENIAVVNSDDLYELLLKKNNVTNKIVSDPEDPLYAPQQSIRARAIELTDKKKLIYIKGMLPLIIDGTGKDFNKTIGIVKSLEDIGYDVSMIYVDVSLETTLDRNSKRDRSLSNEMVTDFWNKVSSNREKYEAYFGEDFHVIDNNNKEAHELKGFKKEVEKLGRQIFREPLKNPKGKEILQNLRDTGKNYMDI